MRGIYKIINTFTGDFYIGSSSNLKRREKEHFSLLEKNKNHSILLQRAYNKYGKGYFKFKILEECEECNIIDLEQYYMDKLNPKYNICKANVTNLLGYKHTKATKLKIGLSNKNKSHPNFGWKSQIIQKLDDVGNVIQEYASLKEYAIIHNCSIANVGKALKKKNRCKGFYIKYK